MEVPAGEVTELLHAWSGGDRTVEERLFSLVLTDLRNLAAGLMRKERSDHTLQPSALVNEAYVRLVSARERDWENRQHFFKVAARIMRRLLIDHARARSNTDKVTFTDGIKFLPGREAQIETAIAIDGLLDELELSHRDWRTMVELKYFMGMTDEETAEVLGLPLRSMQRQFGDARRWLYERVNR